MKLLSFKLGKCSWFIDVHNSYWVFQISLNKILPNVPYNYISPFNSIKACPKKVFSLKVTYG